MNDIDQSGVERSRVASLREQGVARGAAACRLERGAEAWSFSAQRFRNLRVQLAVRATRTTQC